MIKKHIYLFHMSDVNLLSSGVVHPGQIKQKLIWCFSVFYNVYNVLIGNNPHVSGLYQNWTVCV